MLADPVDGAHASAMASGKLSSSEGPPLDEASPELEASKESSAAKPVGDMLPRLPAIDSPDFYKRLGEFELARDTQRNIETRPPDDEAVTLRSMTLAEVYIGRQADSLTAALREIEWVDCVGTIADEIDEARRKDSYATNDFTLYSGSGSLETLSGYGKVNLPADFRRIYGRYYVLGPSMVVLVLTFVLADGQTRRLDAALRNDVESNITQSGSGRAGVQTVYQVKSERAARVREDLRKNCLTWLEQKFPGTLVTDGAHGVPTCSLVSLIKGRPFQTRAEYMRLLELGPGLSGFKFALLEYLYLTPSIGRTRRPEHVAAFNEAEALTLQSYPELSVTPEILHRQIWPFMVKEALEGIFRTFESRMRGIRSDLGKIDFNDGPESRGLMARFLNWLGFSSVTDSLIVAIRNRLLRLSRDIAIVDGDIAAAVVDTDTIIWRDYPWMRPVAKIYAEDRENPAAAARKDLRSLMASVQAQEKGLRQLVVVTGQAASDVQNTGTQKKLNVLTIVLVALTFALVFISIV